MSYSFSVSSASGADLQMVLSALPDEVEVDTDVPKKGWPDIAHLHRKQVSVRAIETSFENEAITVRIMSGAHPDDYHLAMETIKFVAATVNQPIVSEEGVETSAKEFDALFGSAWIKRHSNDSLEMIFDMHRDESTNDSLEIHGVNATIKLGPRMLNEFDAAGDDAKAAFYDRLRRLNYIDDEDISQAAIIVAQHEPTGKLARVSSLGENVTSLLSTRAKILGLSLPAGKDILYVRFNDFVDAAPDLTWLSEDVVLCEAISSDAWHKLIETLTPLALADIGADETLLDEPEDDSVEQGGDKYKAMMAAPAAVFLLIAAADGTIDKKEAKAFQKNILKALTSENEIIQTATLAGLAQFQEILEGLQDGGPQLCLALLASARGAAMEQLGEEVAKAYCEQLYSMAEAIAKASGGGFLGLGSKIGEEEQNALDLLRHVLFP